MAKQYLIRLNPLFLFKCLIPTQIHGLRKETTSPEIWEGDFSFLQIGFQNSYSNDERNSQKEGFVQKTGPSRKPQ